MKVTQRTFHQSGTTYCLRVHSTALALRLLGYKAHQGSEPSAAGSWADTNYIVTDAPLPLVRRVAMTNGLTVRK